MNRTLRGYLGAQYSRRMPLMNALMVVSFVAPIALQAISGLRVAWLAVANLVLISVGFVRWWFGRIRCPRCRQQLGAKAQTYMAWVRSAKFGDGWRATIGGRQEHLAEISCPHCGLTLDEPLT